MRERLTVLEDYTNKQQTELERCQQIYAAKKQTNKRYRELNEKFNDQALHFEIMINRLRPDLLEKAKEEPVDKIVRSDVRTID